MGQTLPMTAGLGIDPGKGCRPSTPNVTADVGVESFGTEEVKVNSIQVWSWSFSRLQLCAAFACALNERDQRLSLT